MKNITFNILFLVVTIAAFAQEVDFTASAPKYVRAGEQFQVQYNVNARVDEFTPPSFDDFKFLGGPMQGTSSSTNIVNGKVNRTVQYTLTYYLQAKEPGKYTIQPAEAVYKKKTVTSNELQIEVVGAASNGSTQQSSTSDQTASNNGASGEELFVSLNFNKSSVYLGEQIIAWVKVYTKVQISDIELRTFKGPEFSGFFVQELEVPPLRNLEREKVGNDLYYSGLIKKYILTPQRSGKNTVAPFDLTVYQQKQVRRSNSMFDEFFGPSYSSVPVNLTSKSKTIQVKSLPENKPSGFSGAVGNFTLKGSLNATQVRTNDAVTFKVVLSGTGNIKLVEDLQYDLSVLEEYDPVIKTNMNKDGLGGTKTFEYTAIPRYSGIYEIEPFKLVYFDPVSATYKTIKTQPFILEVEKNAGDSGSVVISNLSKQDVELLGSDIRFIKMQSNLKKSSSYYIDNPLFYLFYLLSVAIFVFIIFLKRKQIKNNADIARSRNKKANKMAQKRLKYARNLLNQQKPDEFYEELSRALWGYISDKLNMPLSQLSAANAGKALVDRKVEPELAKEVLELIELCEFTRYAPGSSSLQPEDMYSRGVKIILRLEQKIN